MIITLSKEYRIRGTDNCWQLEKAVIRKGQTEWQAFKYFSGIGQAVSEACEREIRLDPATGLNEALQAIDKIATRYSKLLDDALALREAA